MLRSNSIKHSYRTNIIDNKDENVNLKPSVNSGIFLLKSGNQWLLDASVKPPPKPWFLMVWYQGEVGILFAHTNQGKSICAVWILAMISLTQKGVYIDFELSDKQFEARYSSNNLTNRYQFNENFFLWVTLPGNNF